MTNDDIFNRLKALTAHYVENPEVPFDQTPEPAPDGREPRPTVHPDVIIRKVEDWLGRPITRAEYNKIWNAIVDSGWSTDPNRIDYVVDLPCQ